MKKFLSIAFTLMCFVLPSFAQVVTSSPSPLQEKSADVTIYFHADKGNKGLINQPANAQIYAHTGVSTENGDWQYAPNWGDNKAKYKLKYESENIWSLHIVDIHEFYGVPESNHISRLWFVFRTADSKKEAKGDGDSDLFIDITPDGLQLSFSSDAAFNRFYTNRPIRLNVSSTSPATLSLSVSGKVLKSVENATSLDYEFTSDKTEDYQFTASAVTADETVSSTLFAACTSASANVPYPLNNGIPQMGAVRDSEGNVTFCLAAPQKEDVVIFGAWNDYNISCSSVMNYTDVNNQRYFWTTISGLSESTSYPYYFCIDNDRCVGDPYTRLVLDPYNDKYIPTDVFPNLPEYPIEKVQNVPLAVYKADINNYDWKVKSFTGVDKSDLLIYELLVRDFTGTEGKANGNGTILKAAARLDYLKHLGINAVELMPIMEFNGNLSWGYNTNFYFAPDKAYGTPDDYKKFIDECHARGIAVILDIVFNQSDGLHPWYQMYDISSNPFYNATAPHDYSVLNDWKQDNPLVQQQWADCLRYWLTEYHVDGFRFDLVKGLGDNASYTNSSGNATNAYNASRVERMKSLHAVINEVNPDAYFINENLAFEREENEMAEDGQLNWLQLNNAGCEFAMGYSGQSGLEGFYAPNTQRSWGSTVSYLESHDEHRLNYKQKMWGVSGISDNVENQMHRLGSAAAQMILTPGAHLIWQFSELGDGQNTKNSDGSNNTDNKVVNWNYLNNIDRNGLYECYAELNCIRNNNPDLFTQDATFEMHCTANDWADGRTLYSSNDHKELFTIINPNTSGRITCKVNFRNSSDSDYTILSKSRGTMPEFEVTAGTVTVDANCYVVIGSKDVVEVEMPKSPQPDFDIFVNGTTLRVVNTSTPVMIYTLDGRKIGIISSDGCINLHPGIFILKNYNTIKKVVIK